MTQQKSCRYPLHFHQSHHRNTFLHVNNNYDRRKSQIEKNAFAVTTVIIILNFVLQKKRALPQIQLLLHRRFRYPPTAGSPAPAQARQLKTRSAAQDASECFLIDALLNACTRPVHVDVCGRHCGRARFWRGRSIRWDELRFGSSAESFE